MSDPVSPPSVADIREPLRLPQGKTLGVRIIPLQGLQALPGRVGGICAGEATPLAQTAQASQYLCLDPAVRIGPAYRPAPADLIALERLLRTQALSADDRLFIGLNAQPVIDGGTGGFLPFGVPEARPGGTGAADLLGLVRGAGVYQLMSFPVARFNGVALPSGMAIRFADPLRWIQPAAMESRLFTIFTNGKQYYSWDAHNPVGKTPHDFYHVNQKGLAALFGQSNHAPLSGASLVQAKQLRYLKVGGRVFLVVGVVVDSVQMGGAAVESYKKGSVKPIAAQTVRTAGGWAMAWAGAKAGVAVGALAGVESGPGLVLTAIGGGLIGGTAGYFGADWIADWIYED